MSEYQYLRAAMTSRAPLSAFELVSYDAGFATVYWVAGTRAKRPAVIVEQRGPRPIAPSADLLVHDRNATYQLFKAGTDDFFMEATGAFSELWIEPQVRALRV